MIDPNVANAKAEDANKNKAVFDVYEAAIRKAKHPIALPTTILALELAWNANLPLEDIDTIIAAGKSVLAVKVPKEAWWDTLHYKGEIRLADAELLMFNKSGKGDKKELHARRTRPREWQSPGWGARPDRVTLLKSLQS